MGAVVIEGVRGCGKTQTGKHHACSEFFVDQTRNRRLAELSPEAALEGKSPRLIDEWQLVPDLWNDIRYEIDARQRPGQFILSESATPADSITRQTGAGRFSRVRMRPMALGESHPSQGHITLSELRNREVMPPLSNTLSYEELAVEAVRGGWLMSVASQSAGFVRFLRNYLENIAHADLPQLGTQFSPERVRHLLRSIARNIATETSAVTLSQDSSADGGELTSASVRTYCDALTRIFILEELPAWEGSLRSKSRLRKQAKLHFCLLRLKNDRMVTWPDFLAVVTGGYSASTLPSGVHVLPLSGMGVG